MKLTLVGITVLLYAFISTLSHASAERPLLGKYNYPGYVMDEDNKIEQCEVMSSGFIIKTITHYGLGDRPVIVSAETFPLSESVDDVRSMIESAAQEKMLISEFGICDAPSTVMIAYTTVEAAEKGMLSIFSTGGCGEDKKKRDGEASRKITEILNRHCPETFDFDGVEDL